MQLGKTEKVGEIYKDLITRNPENWAYYKGLEDAVKPGKIKILCIQGWHPPKKKKGLRT